MCQKSPHNRLRGRGPGARPPPFAEARGDYLLTRTVNVSLEGHGRLMIDGTGGTAKILMAGAGPAFSVVGNRPNSPVHVTMVLSSKPRSLRSLISAAAGWSVSEQTFGSRSLIREW